MKKRLLSVLMVLVLTLGLCSGAFAFDIMDPPQPGPADGFVKVTSEWTSDSVLPGHRLTEFGYTFDDQGRILTRTETDTNYDDPEGNSTATYLYEYDAEGRLARTVRDDGNHEMVYEYHDDGTHFLKYTWSGSDDSEPTTSYRTYDPCTDWYWFGKWTYTFDEQGNVASRENENGEKIVYTNTCDDQGRLSSVKMVSQKDMTEQTQTFVYNDDGSCVLTWASKTGAEIFTYNAQGWLVQYQNTYYGDDSPVITYRYDENGNNTQIWYSDSTHRDITYAPLGGEPEEDYAKLSVSYDRSLGSVFFGLNETPAADAAHYVNGYWDQRPSYLADGEIGTVKLLLDETKGFDWNAEYQSGEIGFVDSAFAPDRVINIRAWFTRADGSRFSDYVVKDGKAVAEGFTFANGVLTFKPETDQGVELDIRWTQSDEDFLEFGSTEEFPILVHCDYYGSGTVKPEGVAPENMILLENRFKIRLPAGQKSVSFTWGEGDVLEEIQVQDNRAEDGWVEYESPEGTRFTLQLDQMDYSGERPAEQYYLHFQFEYLPVGADGRLYVNYSQSYGSLFLGLNAVPAADAGHYLDNDWENRPSFVADGKPAAVNLLIDPTKAVDWHYWEDGTINLVDAPDLPDRALYVNAVCRLADGTWYDGPIIENGVLTKTDAGFTFQNNVLSFTPIDKTDVRLNVYWTKADKDFDEFQPTAEKQVIVTCYWDGDGTVQIPAGIPEEDVLLQPEKGRVRFRVPLDTESVTFTWPETDRMASVWYYDDSQGGGVSVDTFENASFTLPLNQTNPDGSPSNYYDVNFFFRPKPVADHTARVSYTIAEGSVFWSLGAPASVTDETTYTYAGKEESILTKDGEIGTIYLTLDPTRAADPAELQNGNIRLQQIAPNPDYLPTIVVWQLNEDDEFVSVTAVADGVAAPGYTFRNNVFSFTPSRDSGVYITVFWTKADADFFMFDTTEDKPVMVELVAENGGVLTLPASIPAEDYVVKDSGQYRDILVRLPLDTKTLPVSWSADDTVTLIEIDGAGADGGVLRIENPTGTSYTLNLNQTYENGKPETYYYAFFRFGETAPHTHDTELRGAAAATCTKDGYTGDEVCKTCGEIVKKGSVIKATGHKWDAGKVTKEPTETAEGVKTFTCTVCKATRTESIPKLTPTKPANPFKDVKDGAYYYDPVLWALNHQPQITDGVSDDAFAPDKTCTRGQVVTFLWRANGCPEPKSTSNPFKDVKSGDYFYKAVLWAVEKGITDGTSETTFSPNAGCTRGQVVTFLWRADGKPAASGANPFTDVKTSDYFYQPVLWAGKAGITDGTSNTTFSPDKTCTRGQIVTFLYRDKT